MSVKLGINPIGWTNDCMNWLGDFIPLEQCLAEARQAGFSGVELGRKFPRTVGKLGPLLKKHGLSLVSGWYSAQLLTRDSKAEIAAMSDHLKLLAGETKWHYVTVAKTAKVGVSFVYQAAYGPFPTSVQLLDKVGKVVANIGPKGFSGTLASGLYYVVANEATQTLVGSYADLIALALEPEQFYNPAHIELQMLPSQMIQKVFISSFRQRLIDTMKQAQKINLIQAEQLVWQQIEEELLLPLQPITADQ